jgi:ABC-type lipoprotein release transport system permease subunit
MVGIALGIVGGWVACGLIERFQPAIMSEAVYNVTRLPMVTRLSDVGWVALAGFTLCLVFSFLPAVAAALSRPVGALRYD